MAACANAVHENGKVESSRTRLYSRQPAGKHILDMTPHEFKPGDAGAREPIDKERQVTELLMQFNLDLLYKFGSPELVARVKNVGVDVKTGTAEQFIQAINQVFEEQAG
jgi:hypothetical protein